jgi:RNA polymerase sigma-70 factor, ECF subfamily
MNSIELTTNIEERKIVIEKLFKSYYSIMCKAAFNILNDKPVCEDIVQGIFLKLYENNTYHKIDYPKSFFKRAAVNAAIDIYRKQNRNVFVDIEDINQIEIKEEEFELIDEKKVLAEKIKDAINLLPEKCKLIFILKRTEGYTNKEIAEELNISVKTVENQTTKAFKILKEQLGPLMFILLLIELNIWK